MGVMIEMHTEHKQRQKQR